MGIKTASKNDEFRLSGKQTDIYSDFNHTFLPHPNTGQISRKANVDAVKLAIRNLILTNKYERLRNPGFGTNIRNFLFEPFSNTTESQIKEEIRDAITNYEKRARLLDVKVESNPDDYSIFVNIEFSVVMSKTVENLELVLYRVR